MSIVPKANALISDHPRGGGGGGGGGTPGHTRAWRGIRQLCLIILSPGWGNGLLLHFRSKQDPCGKTCEICKYIYEYL